MFMLWYEISSSNFHDEILNNFWKIFIKKSSNYMNLREQSGSKIRNFGCYIRPRALRL